MTHLKWASLTEHRLVDFTDVSEWNIFLILKGQAVQKECWEHLDNAVVQGIVWLSRNDDNKLPIYPA